MKKEDIYIKMNDIFTKFRYEYFPFILSKTKSAISNVILFAKNNIELIIKISLPILIIILGIYVCGSAKRNTDKVISDLFLISDEIRLHYSNKPDYWRLSTDSAIKEKILSPKYIKNNKILLHGNKELFIGSGKNAGIILPRSLSFDLIIKKLNRSECILFLEANLSKENQVKLENITLSNSSGDYNFSWGSKSYLLPVKAYMGKKLCEETDNTIFWTVK